jgi:hypothetical protein
MQDWLQKKKFSLRNPCPPTLEMNTKDFCATYFDEILRTTNNLAKVIFWQEISLNGKVWLQFIRSFNMGPHFIYDSMNYGSLLDDDIYHLVSVQNCVCKEIFIPLSVDVSKQFNIVRNDDMKPPKYVLYNVQENLLNFSKPHIERELAEELKEKVQSFVSSGFVLGHKNIFGTVRWLALSSINEYGQNALLW